MPRVGLTREKVATAAGDIADEVGFEHFTLAAVADRFGVAVPSLYKHVRGLDALRREVRILGLRELANEVSAAAVGKSRGEALVAIAHGYRSYAGRHPGRYAGTARAPEPGDDVHLDAAAGLLRVVFAVLAGYGIEGDDAVDATRMLHASLHGFVTLERGGSFKMERSVDASFERMVGALDVSLAHWSSPSTRQAPSNAGPVMPAEADPRRTE